MPLVESHPNIPGLRHLLDKRADVPTPIGQIYPRAPDPPSNREQVALKHGDTELLLPVSAVYPVIEDVRFLREHEGSNLSEARTRYYLTENILSFLEEFAGNISLKAANGLVTDTQLQMGGFDMLSVAQRAVAVKEAAGLNSAREQAELEGLTKIHSILSSGEAQTVGWTSGARIANYMMLLVLLVGKYDPSLGGRPAKEYILRVPERLGSIDVSKNLHRSLGRIAGRKAHKEAHSAEDLLRDPIAFKDPGRDILDKATPLMGISGPDLQFAQVYTKHVQSLVRPLINEYIDLVRNYNFMDVSDPKQHRVHDMFRQEAQPLLDKMFALGVKLRQYLKGELSHNEAQAFKPLLQGMEDHSIDHHQSLVTISQYTNHLHPEMIRGGSLCPSWNGGADFAKGMEALVETGHGVTEALGLMMASNGNIIYRNGERHLICYCPMNACPSNTLPRKKVLAKIKHDMITCPCCRQTAPYKC